MSELTTDEVQRALDRLNSEDIDLEEFLKLLQVEAFAVDAEARYHVMRKTLDGLGLKKLEDSCRN